VIICTVDRLGPKYDDTADVWFGVNFSAGITARTGDEALDADLLKPWKWTELKKVLVSVDGADAVEVDLIDPKLPAKTDALQKHFDELFEKEQSDTDFFSFSQFVATGPRWPSLLGHLSTSVAPVPHAMQLTRFFKLAAPGTKIHAAPVFKAGTTTYTPDPKKPGNEWPYDAANVKAVQPGTAVKLPDGSMIDLGSQWIKTEIAGEEWRSSLEQRIAALFDLGQLLVDVARADASPLKDAHAAAFRDAVLRSLYDLANTGAQPRPDGRTLVDDVKAPDAAAVTQALLDYEATVDLAVWRELLEKTDGAVADQMKALDSAKLADVAAALDALQSALADDATLAKIVRAQWAKALETRGDVAEILARFDAALPDIRLHDRLALSNLGRFWMKIREIAVSANDDRVAIRGNTIIALHAWYDSRTVPNHLPDAEVRTKLQAVATQSIDEALKIGAIGPAQVPHPVTLQLDRLFDVADEEDFARRIAGAGVLMRRKGGAWRCLNMAAVHERLEVKMGEPLPGPGDSVVQQAVVPYRMQFINDVRQAFVSYNNHPIVARSRAEGLRGPLLLEPDRHKAASSRLQYEPALADKSDPKTDWNFLPALAFGDEYEVLPFAIGNSGALPSLLAEKAKPISLVTSADFGTKLAADGSVSTLVKTFTYKRRVPVGLPRFAKETLPAIPETVVPLARDSGVGTDVALLLLVRDAGETFTVLPPACDINTWDRWVGRAADDTEAQRAKRRAVWAEVHRQLPSNPLQKQERDVSIDDPAVEKLRFTLSTGGSVDVTPVPMANSGFASVQAQPVPVVCRRTASGTPAIAAASGGVLITMPRGRFATLTIEPILHAGAIGRFEVPVDAKLQIAVEAVSEALPTEEELWRALTVEPRPGGKLEVKLKKGSGAFEFIKGVEVFRQLWRWDGRPIDPFPFDKLTAAPLEENQDVRRWEAIAFADRRDSDALALPAAVNFAGAVTEAKLHTEDRSSDPRAHYLRFAVRVRSRYAGIVEKSVTSLFVDKADPDRLTVTQWKRGLILSRPDEVKKPKVKLVVPLTEADAGQKTPGLLVVLNEPWFDVGGLAEQLRIEVARAVEPKDPPGPNATSFPEVGTDPIVTEKGLDGAPELQTALRPVGFTFDTDAEAPLFVRSSFLVDPPKLDGNVSDLSWVFARLRFRRVIAGKGIEAAGAPDLVSEPTESHWVQFLPDARSYLVKGTNTSVGTAALTVARAGNLFRLQRGATPVVLLPAALDPQRPAQRLFDLWLLVTQEIVDVVGRQKQEKYVGMYRWNEAGATVPIDGPESLSEGGRIVVRVVEVQQRPGDPMDLGDKKWWDRLFNPRGEHDRDAAGRIVRISPPIRQA
jgi:hypothetical protein